MQRTFACVWWWNENSKQNSQLENAEKNVENVDAKSTAAKATAGTATATTIGTATATNCQQQREQF